MKVATIVSGFTAGLLALAPAAVLAQDASPFLGRWAVDVSRLPMPEAERPKSVTFTYSDAGEGKLSTRVEVVQADGSMSSSQVTHALDGTPARVEGNMDADLVAVTSPEPDVLVMALSKDGKPTSMRVFTIAPGGDAQSETAVYYAPDGTPTMRTVRFLRVE